MKNYKPLLFISLLLNLIGLLLGIRHLYLRYNYKTQPIQTEYYLRRDQLFETMPVDTNAIVFIGNSLTQNFELAEYFQNIHIKNRGINGDMVPGVIKRLNAIIKTQPRKLFIEIGTNDLGHMVSPEVVFSNYKQLLDTLQKTCPHTKIHIQSLLPVQVLEGHQTGYCSLQHNESIQKLNDYLKTFAADKHFIYIDLFSKFTTPEDELKPELSVDGIHLSGEGYLLWASVLKPYIEE